MDEKLRSYLEKFNVSYKTHHHKPVFTVKESDAIIKGEIPGRHTKNLFLEDEKGNFYLVCMDAYKRLDIKSLRKRLNAGKLQFASAQKLKQELDVTPGSVSIFCMINASKTKLVLDSQLWNADVLSFHANINTESLELDHKNLERFYNSISMDKEITEL